MTATALSRPLLLAYGLPALPLAVLALPLVVYLPPYYADELGVSLTAVGVVLLAARLWDVVTDPLIGALSDRTASRWGRRRPWLVAGAPLLVLAAWRLLMPPDGAGAGYLTAWSFAAALAWTAIALPYNAWGAELTGDYHQRSRVTASRQGFALLGTLAAVLAPGLVQMAGGSRAEALALTAALVAVALPVAVAAAVLRVPEPAGQGVRVGGVQGLRLLAANRPFRRLLAAYVLNGVANGLPASLFLFFVATVVVPEGSARVASGVFLLTYFLAGVVALPAWLPAARRWGKHRVWCAAMLAACAVFAWVPAIPLGGFWPFFAVCLLTGATLGVDVALPAAMQADVIDADAVEAGGSRAGLYFALWGMGTKLALALAAGLAYPLLELAGFAADGPNDALALWTLALLYGALPVAIKLVAVALMWDFPLDAARQAALRGALASGREAQA